MARPAQQRVRCRRLTNNGSALIQLCPNTRRIMVFTRMCHKYDAFVLNALYLCTSWIYTCSSWLYKGTPELQLLLQSIIKIVFVSVLCKTKTNSMPRIILYDKYLILSSILYSLLSLCTSYLWLSDEITPYAYYMGTKPSLLISDMLQNGMVPTPTRFISVVSVFGLLFVNKALVPLFLLKCVLSSTGSYFLTLGLNFGKESGFEQRCSKIVSFSLISAFVPHYSAPTAST